MDESGGFGFLYGNTGRRHDVGAAEDDDCAEYRSSPVPDQPDHALDDACNVRVLHIPVPCGAGGVHPILEPGRHRHPVFRNGSAVVPRSAWRNGVDSRNRGGG